MQLLKGAKAFWLVPLPVRFPLTTDHAPPVKVQSETFPSSKSSKNRIDRIRFQMFCLALLFLVAMALFCIPGCAGNGDGLDENGNPIGNGGGPLPVDFEPTFANIQTNVFDAICVGCHIGAFAPQGLRLDSANSYSMLVGVPSVERPELFRVAPGNPDASYLIRKLEGGPDIVGAQMPLNLPPLPQNTINAIRVWIAQGAQRN